MTKSLEPLRNVLRKEFAKSPDLKEHSDELLQLAEPYVVLAGVSEGLQLNRTAKAARRQEMKDKLAIGAGRIGFVPDLPPHIPWPATEGKKFMFLAQIDLSEIPRWDGNPLPEDGWLYFFVMFGPKEKLGIPPWKVSVLYHQGPASQLVRAPVPSPGSVWGEPFAKPAETAFDLVPLMPRLSLAIGENQLQEQDLDDLSFDVETLLDKVMPQHPESKSSEEWRSGGYLLGQIPSIDGTPTQNAHDQSQPGNDWLLLLTIFNAGNIYWGDAGRVYFLIRQEHLAKRDFSQVLMGMACS
jgi:uncharacterized protein YwqG